MLKIFGHGLLANSFSNAAFNRPCLLLASGVSNSGEIRLSEFRREREVVIDAIAQNSNRHTIYLSSCSLYQVKITPYIEHKMEMEELIASLAPSYSIFRLPQAVGAVRNNTLISYFVENILDRQVVAIQKDAKRNLIGVDDVVRISELMVNYNHFDNSVINIASKNSAAVIDIFNEISGILGVDAHFDLVDGGECYDIPIDHLYASLNHGDPVFSDGYWRKVLSKYVPVIGAIYDSVGKKNYEK